MRIIIERDDPVEQTEMLCTAVVRCGFECYEQHKDMDGENWNHGVPTEIFDRKFEEEFWVGVCYSDGTAFSYNWVTPSNMEIEQLEGNERTTAKGGAI